jgi:hypothetical protein
VVEEEFGKAFYSPIIPVTRNLLIKITIYV